MKLAELISGLAIEEPRHGAEVDVTDLAYDSRAAGPGTLFFCVTGMTSDGHEFAPEVVKRGAVALVVERPLELEVPQVRVADARAAMAPFAARFFGDPTEVLELVGITGTNGKTTTAFLLREVIEADGRQCGLLGTVKRIVGGAEEDVERTTPEAIDLQRTFRRMLDAGDRACAMEVSSHALSLHRTEHVHFDCAAFTNLTQDHLDFHADMEDYFQAKRLLFAAGPRRAVVNMDDTYGRRLASEYECLTYSVEGAAEADLRASAISFDAGGARFTVRGLNGELEVSTRLPGHFNVANALAALAASQALGIGAEVAIGALAEADRVPGRFEPVEAGQPFTVLVDYAHTPDSLENVLRAARRLTAGQLISVFGCGGDRDREKRPRMGRIGAELSDLAVVTSDNPRSEDPEGIIAEIVAGSGTESMRVEPDRRTAIALALTAAEQGDVVVIAGKGHEQGQEFENGRVVPFDDREVAHEELETLLSGAAQ